ncbi:MAG: hypothetical protein KatS3mg076_2136 [Candidatus Binatia bacterium]|nr:MAG: hypothetical protein KatS3mg076_2136 [Candidatus Binatia bacterium]
MTRERSRRPPLPAGPRSGGREDLPGFLDARVRVAVIESEKPITGKLSFQGPTRIEAELRGEVRCRDLLVVGKGGSVRGDVHAVQLVVYGVVRGRVFGAERVEVAPEGRLLADVETRSLVVRPGGVFDGNCRSPGVSEP